VRLTRRWFWRILEAALATSNPAAAPLTLEGPVARAERGEVAPAALATTPRTRKAWRSGLRFVHPKRPAAQLFSIQGFNGFRGVLRVLELDEGKPAWPTRRPVEWDHHVYDRPHRAEGLDQLVASDVKTQVSDK